MQALSGQWIPELEPQPVVSEGDCLWKTRGRVRVSHVVRQVREIRHSGSELACKCHGLVNRKVRRVGAVAEAIQNKNIESGQKFSLLRSDGVAVGAVGEVAD